MEIASFVLALLALGLSLVNAYKTWWEKAKLEAIPASSIELVTGRGEGRTSAIRLCCNFVNPTGRLATLQHLELEARAIGGPRMDFVWKAFLAGPASGEKIVNAIPVVVGAHDSRFLTISFEPMAGPGDVWASGRYSVTLKGWMNRPDRRAEPNVISRPYHFSVNRDAIEKAHLMSTSIGFEEWLPPRGA